MSANVVSMSRSRSVGLRDFADAAAGGPGGALGRLTWGGTVGKEERWSGRRADPSSMDTFGGALGRRFCGGEGCCGADTRFEGGTARLLGGEEDLGLE